MVSSDFAPGARRLARQYFAPAPHSARTFAFGRWGRSLLRKGIEAYFTVLIEVFWSKKRIMEVYLNEIEMAMVFMELKRRHKLISISQHLI